MANDYSNIRNNFMYGSKNRKNNFYQNYKNFENDLDSLFPLMNNIHHFLVGE